MLIRDRIVELRRVKASDLAPNPKNWRKHPKAQADALRGVLAEVGYADALLARQLPGGGLMLVDGHLRAETTPDAEVPVLVLDVTEAEADKILLTLDPLAAMAEADADALSSLLAGFETDSEAVRKMLSDLSDEAGIEKPAVAAPEARIDEAEELRKKWGVERGQLWVIGKHRLLCGDSTSAEDVGRLMGGERAGLCLTDPPYGADIKYAGYDDTQDALAGLVRGFFPLARQHADLIALTPGIQNVWLYEKPDWMLCWFYAAGTGRTPWGFSAWQPVVVWGKDPKLANGEGAHPDGFNWPMSREDAAERKGIDHVCPKPTSSWIKWMERLSSEKTTLVYEPFSGAGTTFIAAEQLSRRCYGLDIEPKYVAVALQRLADMGLTPERVDG